ncbi:MAG TPA: diguanylate cyclase [Spirochaetia bacterium]|nr:diguanylate cyclase [Spirochaetia bacterium]
MQMMSDRVRAKIELLGQRFVESLPERIVKLRAAFAQTTDRKSDSEEFVIFRNEAHKLAGSGASFGFASISDRAKQLELYLDELIAAKSNLPRDQWENLKPMIDQVEEECSRAVQPEGGAAEQVDAEIQMQVAFENENRVVLLAEGDQYVTDDFIKQVSFFGFPTKRVKKYEDSLSLPEQRNIFIVIATKQYLEENPGTRAQLSELRRRNSERFRIILLSDMDDFDTRLFGVRLGGNAFFSFPVDIPRLVDSIDKMTQDYDTSPFHVMIIDDDVEQVSMNALILQNAGMITSVATDPRNIFKVLVETKPEIILVDLYMKGCDGRELAQLIRQQEAYVGIPIVFLSVEQDPDVQIDAIRAGGDEFLTKPVRPDHLVASIEMRARRTRNVRFFMERDSLTGLLNHAHLMEGLTNEIRRAERIGTDLCFAMIDLDHFKTVNDTFGHLTGDRVLKSLARLLQDRLRKTDLVGRYGGEEFGIVFSNTSTDNAERILNEVRETFARIRHSVGSKDFYSTFSCGVAGYSLFGSAAALGKAADSALYRAKENGRNAVAVATG